MTAEERRNDIIKTMQKADVPISGAALASKYQVSRQIIVQDIALLRAADYNILSTPRGYMLSRPVHINAGELQVQKKNCCVFHVFHTDDQIEDELNLIVDNGGKILDVFVEHEVYGCIRADLLIQCRRHVQDFIAGLASGKSSPLKNVTSGVHYHTVEADSEETLEIIAAELSKRGYLISE